MKVLTLTTRKVIKRHTQPKSIRCHKFRLRKGGRKQATRVVTQNTPNQPTSDLVTEHLLDEDFTKVDTSWDIDSYRSQYDTNSLWNLKKWFMELHKEKIPENELVPLAQSFANVEALGCLYAPDFMKLLTELGEPIARVYRRLKSTKCVRILVPADEAARCHQQGICYTQHVENVRQWKIESLLPISPTYTLAEIFQNIVLVNSSLKETIEWFERLGSGTISLAMRQAVYGMYGLYEIKAYVGNVFITKADGFPYEKAYSQCVANLIDILRKYCYQVNYIRRFPTLYYNVEKLHGETVTGETNCLRRDNIGYRMLQRLGWTGGPLGYKQTGIVNPIEFSVKNDRLGLGCSKKAKKKRQSVLPNDCSMDVDFYDDLMQAALDRQPYYDLIFSPEFTENERIMLTRLAGQRRIRCETRQLENGQAQFVVKRHPLPPHDVLIQVLVEKHPFVQRFYEVIPPKLGFIPK